MKKIIYVLLMLMLGSFLILGLSSTFAASNFTNKDLTGEIPTITTDAHIKGIRMSWNLNTESDMSSYMLYYSVGSLDNFTSHSIIIHPTNIWISDFKLIRYNTYYWVVTALDSSGNESKLSNIVQVNIINSNPQFTSSTFYL